MAGHVRQVWAAALISLALFAALPAKAQVVLRDAEMERALRELARPVIAQSGLSPGSIRILVIKDDRMNAFVLDSRTIFIHSGLLLRMERAEMLQAVIAHEVAHIANGHLTQRPAAFRRARNSIAIGGLLCALAGSSSGNGAAAGGCALGAASTSQRVFFAHTRAQESSADQAGIRYLARANIDPGAMADVMRLFAGQEALSSARQDPYLRTHPLSRERVRAIQGFASAFKEIEGTSERSKYWYERVQGKLSAYIRSPKWTLRRVGTKDQSDVALIRRAFAYHKNSQTKKALNEVNKLINKRPRDAFAHELKGQILLETRQFNAAAASYGKAVSLEPNQPLILAGYGRALLAKKDMGKALQVLTRAHNRDSFNPRLKRDLAQAYAATGNPGMASVLTAERYALAGRLKDAGIHAKRAMDLLPQGSAGWRRAADIADAAKKATRGRK